MKRILLFMLLLITPLSAQKKLVWDANTEPDLAGYKVYFGYASRQYEMIVDTGLNNFMALDAKETRPRYFAVVAYDTAGNVSDFSEELVYTPNDTAKFNCDCNRDGRIDPLDYSLLRRLIGTNKYLTDGKPNAKYNQNYDINADEKIDALDRALYKKCCQ